MNDRIPGPKRRGAIKHFASGQAWHLGSAGGELTVTDGCIWLTRSHDLHDYFVGPGRQVRLFAGEQVVIEPAPGNQGARVCWEPLRPELVRALLAGPLRCAAFISTLAAHRFTRLALSAAAITHRIQAHLEDYMESRELLIDDRSQRAIR
jgi:hypothetical protein